MRIIEVKHNQSLLDISIQEYGNIEGVFWIVEDNNLNGITDNVYPGYKLNIRDSVINSISKQFLSNKETIATVNGARGTGIGYMILEQDFIVN